MRIQAIEVLGLFGTFDHRIPLNHSDGVTIIHGPNGYGKTITLKMIAALVAGRMSIFERVPFQSFSAILEDGSKVSVRRKKDLPQKSDMGRSSKIEIIMIDPENVEHSIVNRDNLPDVPKNILDLIDNQIPSPYSRMGSGWINRNNGRKFTVDQIVDLFPAVAELLPEKYSARPLPVFDDLEVFFVETKRLDAEALKGLNDPRNAFPFDYPAFEDGLDAPRQQLRVDQYSQDIVTRIKSALGDYARHSQESDRTFPERLVRFDRDREKSLSEKDILTKMQELELKRQRLVSIGFLDRETGLQGLDEQDVKRAAEALTIYVKDVQQKLAVFDDLADRVGRLMDIVNARFKNKRLTLNRESGFRLVTNSGEAVDLEDLSSGEQHELVVLYELLFRAPKNGLVLVDEPEISLHVAWQSHFLQDLMGILKLTNSYGIVATHSPVIIGSRWDLTKELSAPFANDVEAENAR